MKVRFGYDVGFEFCLIREIFIHFENPKSKIVPLRIGLGAKMTRRSRLAKFLTKPQHFVVSHPTNAFPVNKILIFRMSENRFDEGMKYTIIYRILNALHF